MVPSRQDRILQKTGTLKWNKLFLRAHSSSQPMRLTFCPLKEKHIPLSNENREVSGSRCLSQEHTDSSMDKDLKT